MASHSSVYRTIAGKRLVTLTSGDDFLISTDESPWTFSSYLHGVYLTSGHDRR